MIGPVGDVSSRGHSGHMRHTSAQSVTRVGVSVTKLQRCSAIGGARIGLSVSRACRIRPSWATVATRVPSSVKTRARARPRAAGGRRRPLVVEPPLVGAERPVEPDRVVQRGRLEARVAEVTPCGDEGGAEQRHVAGVGERRQVVGRVVGEPAVDADPQLGAGRPGRVVGEVVRRSCRGSGRRAPPTPWRSSPTTAPRRLARSAKLDAGVGAARRPRASRPGARSRPRSRWKLAVMK